MHLHLFSSLISCRWHFQPVRTLTQSKSAKVWFRSSLRCCGWWARCWQWSSSSSLSSPSCSLRSKKTVLSHSPLSVRVCVRANVWTFFGLRQEWKWDMLSFATWTQLLADQTVTGSFPKIIYSATGEIPQAGLICLSENPHSSPNDFGPVCHF